jgi:two-component system response regulator AtoC
MTVPRASSAPLVLLVDDDPAVLTVLEALLEQAGFGSVSVDSAQEAIELLDARPFDVVLSDVKMPEMDGIELLRKVVSRRSDLPVVLITAHGTVPMAVEAMKAGAADFLLKPFDRAEVIFVLRKAILAAQHDGNELPPSRPLSQKLVGDGAAMREVLELVRRNAAGAAAVLLRGESGTGKDVVARALHDRGPRGDGPFVKVHCSALPEPLLASELFGHEQGAFSGAARRKAGRIELARGGTLFLDGIEHLPMGVQVKLAGVLLDGHLERLGGEDRVETDVRVIAATRCDLEAMVTAGTFREDLFYRLNVVPIWLPPLRARSGDIGALAEHFGSLLCAAHGRPAVGFSPEAVALLAAQRWPGNVRQLENLIERVVVLSDAVDVGPEVIQRELDRRGGAPAPPSHPAPLVPHDEGDIDLDRRRRDAEALALRAALDRANNNRTLAARLLGISRRTLYNKLDEHGIA